MSGGWGMAFVPPNLMPRNSHELWYETLRHSNQYVPSTPNNRDLFRNIPIEPGMTVQEGREAERVRRARATPLGQLRHDEQMLQLRLQRIRDFGSTWLRPPGRPKTLQGERDELAERLEAERLQALEAANGGGDGLIDGGDEDDPGAAVRIIGNRMMQANDDSEIVVPGEANLDEEIPEGDGFEGDEEDDSSVEDDLDDEIPLAEATYISSEESESGSSLVSENEYLNNRFRTPEIRRPRAARSSSRGIDTENSSQYIAFSNDDRIGDVSFRTHMQGGTRIRGQLAAQAVEDDDDDDDHEMEVDSDDE